LASTATGSSEDRIAAKSVSNEIVHEVGLFTIARIAGGAVLKDRVIDGMDQTDFFLGKSNEVCSRRFRHLPG
jgi:hypothetical protein